MEIGDILNTVKAATQTVSVCLDGTLSEQIDRCTERWAQLTATAPSTIAPLPEVEAVLEEIRALETQATAATVEFRVQSVGARVWRDLVADHPPPPDDFEAFRWNNETFQPAALALCCVDPVMSIEQADELANKLTDKQWQKIITAVLVVNIGEDLISNFGPATVGTTTSD
jgi:hypothetical protein